MNPFRNRKPVLDPAAFYGRQQELKAICERLMAQPPQCCVIIGEPRSGKTSLLYYLASLSEDNQSAGHLYLGDPRRFVFAYVNAGPYIEPGIFQAQASLFFWRDLYQALARVIPGAPALPVMLERQDPDARVLTSIYEIRSEVEHLIREHEQYTMVLLIDNIEGIARLPRPNSSLLRTLTQDPGIARRIAYIATSRVPVQQLYTPTTWQEPSSLWSLFDGSVYLGLLDRSAAEDLILQSAMYPHRDLFSAEDVAFIRHLAGRHPDMLAIACEHLHDWYALEPAPLDLAARIRLTQQISEAALPLCQSLWESIHESGTNSQEVLWELAHGRPPGTEDQMRLLYDLERRGLVERRGHPWYIFSEVMRQFIQHQPQPVTIAVSDQDTRQNGNGAGHRKGDSLYTNELEQTAPLIVAASSLQPSEETAVPLSPPFTHLEGEVFAYLQAHAGVVCDRDEIKRAIWKDALPSDSALQKIIERIREKIEPDPRNPRRLIAVRGQGYMLRPDRL